MFLSHLARGPGPCSRGRDRSIQGRDRFVPHPGRAAWGRIRRMNEQHVLQAMQAIRAHLARSPRAGDTIRGIHMWWIGWTEPAPHAAVTEQALQRLAGEGLVEQCVMEDGTGVWRRRQVAGEV